MVLLKIQTEYLNTATSWKGKLDTQAGRLDPKKEEVRITFQTMTSNEI